jgi:hypothetical protein
MVAGPPVFAEASRVLFPPGDQPHTLAVVGAELIVGRVIPHQRSGAKTGRFVLALVALEFRVGSPSILIQRLAIAGAARFALGAVVTHGRTGVPEALFHEDFAIVPDEPIFAFAVISRVLRLEVEVIVLFPERRDAGGARRSVFAVEGGHLGAGSGLAVLHCNYETFMIACDDSGT